MRLLLARFWCALIGHREVVLPWEEFGFGKTRCSRCQTVLTHLDYP